MLFSWNCRIVKNRRLFPSAQMHRFQVWMATYFLGKLSAYFSETYSVVFPSAQIGMGSWISARPPCTYFSGPPISARLPCTYFSFIFLAEDGHRKAGRRRGSQSPVRHGVLNKCTTSVHLCFWFFFADNGHRKTRGRQGRQSPGRQLAIQQVNGCAHFQISVSTAARRVTGYVM